MIFISVITENKPFRRLKIAICGQFIIFFPNGRKNNFTAFCRQKFDHLPIKINISIIRPANKSKSFFRECVRRERLFFGSAELLIRHRPFAADGVEFHGVRLYFHNIRVNGYIHRYRTAVFPNAFGIVQIGSPFHKDVPFGNVNMRCNSAFALDYRNYLRIAVDDESNVYRFFRAPVKLR